MEPSSVDAEEKEYLRNPYGAVLEYLGASVRELQETQPKTHAKMFADMQRDYAQLIDEPISVAPKMFRSEQPELFKTQPGAFAFYLALIKALATAESNKHDFAWHYMNFTLMQQTECLKSFSKKQMQMKSKTMLFTMLRYMNATWSKLALKVFEILSSKVPPHLLPELQAWLDLFHEALDALTEGTHFVTESMRHGIPWENSGVMTLCFDCAFIWSIAVPGIPLPFVPTESLWWSLTRMLADKIKDKVKPYAINSEDCRSVNIQFLAWGLTFWKGAFLEGDIRNFPQCSNLFHFMRNEASCPIAPAAMVKLLCDAIARADPSPYSPESAVTQFLRQAKSRKMKRRKRIRAKDHAKQREKQQAPECHFCLEERPRVTSQCGCVAICQECHADWPGCPYNFHPSPDSSNSSSSSSSK